MKDDMEYLGNSLDPSSTTFDGDITAVVKGKCVFGVVVFAFPIQGEGAGVGNG